MPADERLAVLPSPALAEPLEVWGGAEYTCNRVRDRYFDQMELSGHSARHNDMERIHDLGIRTIRTGLLWERHEVDPSWRWEDERLETMRQLGLRPIAGLLHHGSGPRHTNLLDPGFPEKLADYARQVAERYPWIDAYTPVNEPHTTARFSGMYGLWYPHHRTRGSYLRALLNQLKGTVLSMEAIRKVRSDAQLIQTDDVGNISGTAHLRLTWELLNERQWLPFDLLCGKVDRTHPLFGYMLHEGITEREICWFAEHPCPPSTLGVNYYPTSDRYLDHRLHLYPEDRRSSEGPFVDVEALRAFDAPLVNVGTLLKRAWQRYSLPVAITEVHVGGHVDDQIRWLGEAWRSCTQVRRDGVCCTALTIWAIFGSYYWNELVTHENHHYEAGAFHVSNGKPSPTELADFLKTLSPHRSPQHPALQHQGWWRCEDRFCFPLQDSPEDIAA